MADFFERVNTPISTRELERRWAAVRIAMADRKIDVLLMQNNNDFMGGYVKYFTDIPAVTGYPVTVVFPRDDDMTLVVEGEFGAERAPPPQGDDIYRGVKRVVSAPYFASAYYTSDYDAELAEKALAPYSGATIGLVGRATLPVSMIERLRNGRLANATFVDVSDLVDQVKCVKSDEEIALVRRTAALQDKAMEAVMKAVKPGKRDVELAAIAEHIILDGGGEQALLLTCSHPPGDPLNRYFRHFQNRTLRAGDMFSLLIETNGPGGLYTEISRTCVLGKATQTMKDEFAFLLDAREFTLSRLKPGASCKDIWDSYNAHLRRNRRPEERRLYCHGQGYDLVERPLVRFDEPMRIQSNMNLACHPTWVANEMFATICDNFLVGQTAVTERLHKFPEILIELG